MRDCCRDAQVTILAWCLMSDHVDLVLLDYEDKMSAAMQRLLLTYARRFNKRTGRAGCLFRERFERRSLDTDWQVMEAIRSVHADPQEAGMSLIERYPWSSFAEHLRAYDSDAADVTRGFSDPSCVLELFGSAEGFIVHSLSTPDGGEPALCDMKETEWERHAFADRLAKSLGFRFAMLKPHRRRGAIPLLLDCTMPVSRCARLSGIPGLAKVLPLVLCVLMRRWTRRPRARNKGRKKMAESRKLSDSANRILQIRDKYY